MLRVYGDDNVMSTNVAKPKKVAIIGASGTYGTGILARAEEISVEAVVITRSPHKFRHGHAVYLKKRSKDMADAKAASQNLMHSSVLTTDKLYGILGSDDVGARIASMSGDPGSIEGKSREELIELLQAVLRELQR